MNLYLYHNSEQKTSPEYTLKLQNQYKTTFFSPLLFWFPSITKLLKSIDYQLQLNFYPIKFLSYIKFFRYTKNNKIQILK